jgi:flagellar biosynthesis/type III secretory pathway protein FliH
VTTSAFVDQIDKLPPIAKDDLIRRVSGRARTELAELREEAREQGKSEGYMVGFGDGQQAGYRDGYAKGRVEAREEHGAKLAQEFETVRNAL